MTIDELNTLNDHEHIEIEDGLLLQREIDTQLRIRHSGGRFIILVLGAMVWGLLMLIYSKLTFAIKNGPGKGLLSFLFFFVTLGMAVVISQSIWKAAGVAGRSWLRSILHYWPVAFYFVTGVFVFLKVPAS